MKQSGLPDFKVADLNQDLKVLEYARYDAAEYVSRDDFKHQRKQNLYMNTFVHKT